MDGTGALTDRPGDARGMPGAPDGQPFSSSSGPSTLSGPSTPTSLATKIDRLFRTTHLPGSTTEYTYEQVAAAIAARGGPTISASYLYLLRRGLRDNPTKRHLEALASFFNVPASYFLDSHDPAEEERLGLLSMLRNPRVHTLAVTAAALPDAELDVVTQLVTLAGDLDALRGAARNRSTHPDLDEQARSGVSARSGSGSRSPAESGQAVELGLAHAWICLQDGQARQALHHLETVAGLNVKEPRLHDERAWLTAFAHEALNEPEQALALLLEIFGGCLKGSCTLSLTMVALQICQLELTAGDRLAALDAGRRALSELSARGLGHTGDYLRLATVVMEAHADLGQLLPAAALARQVLTLAERLGDPQQQADLYLRCARTAQARGRLGEAVVLANQALSLVGPCPGVGTGVGTGPRSRTTSGGDGGLAPMTSAEIPRLQLAAASCLLRSVRPGSPLPADEDPEDGVAVTEAEMVATAVAALESCRTALDAHGTPEDRGRWSGHRALADLLLGEPVPAEVNARRGLAQLSGLAHPATVEAHLVLGDALRAQNRHAHADAAHEQASRVLAGLSPQRWGPWSAGIWRSLGDRWERRGECTRAANAYRRALDAAQLSGTRSEPVPIA